MVMKLNGYMSMYAEIELQPPSDAITAVCFHSKDNDKLLVSAWDSVRDATLGEDR